MDHNAGASSYSITLALFVLPAEPERSFAIRSLQWFPQGYKLVYHPNTKLRHMPPISVRV